MSGLHPKFLTLGSPESIFQRQRTQLPQSSPALCEIRQPASWQDHIVLLADNDFFKNLPAWVTDNFTVTPGGYHYGQPSRNELVIFVDGSYLEFFNWYDTPLSLDDEDLPLRFWGPNTPGLIDFAITDTTHSAEESVDPVNQRLTEGPEKDSGLSIRFGNPIAGSRKKADGTVIKWKVTRPEFWKPSPASILNLEIRADTSLETISGGSIITYSTLKAIETVIWL
ncbi:glyoxalase bleomycin resistance dioxygenase superfamily [Fusarium beomiforme]|uniref:Glyoxalase bleomycin resistance dioxygenase superfamily n=1 Tax=Fusarium beomiforme TaxID=44412 RepID=A0A9P5A731_9HYPO|nr:glyoxalase bleomycin resistance dioxygenase superfamily [Fusarium beomiforme]